MDPWPSFDSQRIVQFWKKLRRREHLPTRLHAGVAQLLGGLEGVVEGALAAVEPVGCLPHAKE
jgi:hypothetical protein